MKVIKEGAQGTAVEDIQSRLVALNYDIDKSELERAYFGTSTQRACKRFRHDQGLTPVGEIDDASWSALVDESFDFGSRTLYLRLPNYHGRDVRILQERLSILGFACGEADGRFGVHTEAAVRQFQESVGLLADGMAFPDTFDAIDRLRHVWGGKPADGPHPMGGMSFARAANVLEDVCIYLDAEDAISRSVLGRIWNLAKATNEEADVLLAPLPESEVHSDKRQIGFILGCSDRPVVSNIANVILEDSETLAQRICSALEAVKGEKELVRLQLPCRDSLDGSFTTSDAQTLAVFTLDAICSALDVSA